MNQRDLASFATWWLSSQLSNQKAMLPVLNDFQQEHLSLFMQSFAYDEEIGRFDRLLIEASTAMYDGKADAQSEFNRYRNQLLARFYVFNRAQLDAIHLTFEQWLILK